MKKDHSTGREGPGEHLAPNLVSLQASEPRPLTYLHPPIANVVEPKEQLIQAMGALLGVCDMLQSVLSEITGGEL